AKRPKSGKRQPTLIRYAMKPTTKIRFTEPQLALLMRAHPNCNLDRLAELSFEFDQAGKIVDCTGTIKDGGNIDHDYAGSGLARLYETARRRLAARQTSATVLQFPNGERLAKCIDPGSAWPSLAQQPGRCLPPKIQGAKLGFANAGRIFQHGIEDRPQLPGRAANHPQHLRGRGLLLQSVGELPFQVGIGCAQAVNVSSRLRSRRTKTGNACSALRPFSRQGHLVGTVTGPLPVRPAKDRAYQS